MQDSCLCVEPGMTGQQQRDDQCMRHGQTTGANVCPCYCLPLYLSQDRNIQTSAEWRRAMGEVDTGVFKHMREQIKGGFDEERYASRIGFASLKR